MIEEEVLLAINLLEDFFPESEKEPTLPASATREQLWARILELERKPRKKPRVADAVRLLVEEKRLVHLNYQIISKIIREVFTANGFSTRCSESSIRWYLSQCHDWDPKQRRRV
ncbi:hypothetical protein DRN75_00830 [Nanoarchaeota archaeon]|nr:MAG: hypothetical protein DRN75_00830 [Nanoarchaeota archaeon]